MERGAGIIMPILSLPSRHGIGTLGKEAYKFADFLADAGQKYWQLLPLCPTAYGDSPYMGVSSFAGNPNFIDLDFLIEDGLLLKKEADGVDWGSDPGHVTYKKINESRIRLLKKAKERGWKKDAGAAGEFAAKNPWVSDYALYMALKRKFRGHEWTRWNDESVKSRDKSALEKYKKELRDDYELYIYIQYLFFLQWDRLRGYVKEKGIKLIGDIPMYVAMDCADVWASPENFTLDGEYNPVAVAGVPPDYFNKEGQHWGNPLYDWDRMSRNGYKWWIERVGSAAGMFDAIRIDHFRGFDTYWSIPAGSAGAKDGKWEKGPGLELVKRLIEWFPQTQFIAEDLGELSQSVREMLRKSGLPGMKVLQFAFDTTEPSMYLPHAYEKNFICYTGTHDNMTLAQWYESAPRGEVAFAKKYMNITGRGSEKFCHGMIRGGMRSVADVFIAPMQDWLGLGEEGRMNVPGTALGNWTWRMMPDEAGGELAAEIAQMTGEYGR